MSENYMQALAEENLLVECIRCLGNGYVVDVEDYQFVKKECDCVKEVVDNLY